MCRPISIRGKNSPCTFSFTLVLQCLRLHTKTTRNESRKKALGKPDVRKFFISLCKCDKGKPPLHSHPMACLYKTWTTMCDFMIHLFLLDHLLTSHWKHFPLMIGYPTLSSDIGFHFNITEFWGTFWCPKHCEDVSQCVCWGYVAIGVCVVLGVNRKHAGALVDCWLICSMYKS